MELTNKLTESEGVAYKLQQQLIQSKHDREHENQVAYKEIKALQSQISILQEQTSTVEEVASKLIEEEDKVKDMEEEKLVLTAQVNAYSRQCEELKKTMVQLQEKSKTLEEQVYHKERIASEVHVMYVTN